MNKTPINEEANFRLLQLTDFKASENENYYFQNNEISQSRELNDSDELLDLSAADFNDDSGFSKNDSENKYRALTKLVYDPLIVFDLETGLILEVNEKAQQSYQISGEKLINQPFHIFWQSLELESFFLDELRKKGSVENFNTVQRCFNGTFFEVSINAAIIEHENRQIVLAVLNNITEHLRIEQNILRARQEWSDTVDAVSDLIILEDADGNLRRCNRASSIFFNLPFLDLVGNPVNSLIRKKYEDLPNNQTEIEENSHLRMVSWEGQIAGRNNWYEITNHALPKEKAKNAGWVHIVKDITGRKSAEFELQRLYTAIEQAADAILITDLKGFIRFSNTAFEKMSGWSSLECFGRRVSDVKTGLNDDTNIEEIFSDLQNGEIWQKIFKAQRRNGEIFDEQATISLVKDDHCGPINYVFVCRDVTETRRLESIAEAVNMMDNVGYIFSGIRHELGNPINSVKTALTVLKQNLDVWEKDRIDLYIERSLTETARVEYLLRTLKTFSMHENPQIKPVDLTKYMEKFVALVAGDFAGRTIEVELENKGNIGQAFCDARALHQVMLNLMANAADALADCADPKIKICIARAKNRIFITVCDNGAGMSESQLSNLFKPFYTSKAKGTGLGLVIVKSMLGKMNGTISVESRQNVGTEITFTLEAVENQ